MICFNKILISVILLSAYHGIIYQAALSSPEQKLLETILNPGRKSHARPVINSSHVMTYYMGLEIVQLLDASTERQALHVTGILRQQWRNELIVWNPADYGNLTFINLDPDQVWTPETVLYNGIAKLNDPGREKGEWTTHDIKTKITHEYNGVSTWVSLMSLESSCNFDVTALPHDVQKCVIILGPWIDTSKIRCHQNNVSVITSDFKKNAEWEIVSTKQVIVNRHYQCCDEPVSILNVELVMKRKPLYYYFNFILPCGFLIAAILAGHWLLPQCGERIALCITVGLASYFMLNFVLVHVLPQTSNASVIYKLYIVLIGIILMSTIGTCCIMIMYHTPQVYYTWFPEIIEKWYIPRDLWLSSLIADGIIERARDSHYKQKWGNAVELTRIYEEVQGRYGCNLLCDPVIGAYNRFPQSVDKKILKELTFLNDTVFEQQRQKRIERRAVYITELADRALFWILLSSAIVASLVVMLNVII